MTNTGSTHKALSLEQRQLPARQTVGMLIGNPAYRRLLEGIAVNLELNPVALEEPDLSAEQVLQLEMVIADEAAARHIRALIKERPKPEEQLTPALVALIAGPRTAPGKQDEESFDAVLAMPESPALLNARLGVALYAHRAFAQRYQSAFEELNLNRSIFRSVTSGISIANAQLPDMPLMYVNPAFEIMTGYTFEEVEGKNCRFLQNNDSEQPGLTLVREALEQQRETVAVLKNYRKDGELFWNELTLSPIHNRDGVLTHFVGIQSDVTERVEFESALREAEKLAAVGRLAAVIAHEINNPLEAMMNLVYLAQEDAKTNGQGNAERYLGMVDKELRRTKQITAQSLRFYKQSHGPEAVTCEDLLGSVLEVYAPRFTNCGIELQTRYRSTQHIVCLESEIRQVFSNLVTNAIDAMSRQSGILHVRTREATDWRSERKGVVITVADTGVGMSAATQASMYRAFFTTKGLRGTGLGLWISSEILFRHRGHLRVRSSQGADRHGTVFQLFLPFQAAAGEAQANRP